MEAERILRQRYRLERMIGRGGTAEVYLATDLRRQVSVAVKVLREDLAEDPEFVERFMREAEALARLDHPYIVRFYSFERDGGTAFIVMDYVPGTTLRTRMLEAGGPLLLPEATSILRQLTAALHYAHALGYIHRDIKPANVMLRQDGTALLSDFGIARATESATITLGPLGTPAYMSPEQIAGRALGPATDIYSLGVVLYEMVAGRRPFVGEMGSGSSALERVRYEHTHLPPPDPLRANPSLPAAVGAVITRALAKDPAERWPDVVSMAAAWEHAVTQAAPPPRSLGASSVAAATPAHRPSPLPVAIVVVVLLLVAAVGAGAAMLLRSEGEPTAQAQRQPSRATLAVPTSTQPPLTEPTAAPLSATATATSAPAVVATARSTAAATSQAGIPTATTGADREIYDAIARYTDIRALAEETLDPNLLAEVCVDPYLSWKAARIEENRSGGTHWETVSADFTITSVSIDGDTAEVWVTKTETKLYYQPGATEPDDMACGEHIYSYRGCTYDAQYILLRRDGRWFVSEANAPDANCATVCQR